MKRESEREKLMDEVHPSLFTFQSIVEVHSIIVRFSLIIGRYFGRCLRREKNTRT
jgi:hypothetical protein